MEGYIFTHNLCSGYFPDHIPLDDNTLAKLYNDNDKPKYYPYIVNGRYLKQIFNSNSKYNKDYLLKNKTAFAISKKFWGGSFPPPHGFCNECGGVARINNINSSTIDYSNKSKDSNKYNNRIIKLNPSHPVDSNGSGGVGNRCRGNSQFPSGHHPDHPDQLPGFIHRDGLDLHTQYGEDKVHRYGNYRGGDQSLPHHKGNKPVQWDPPGRDQTYKGGSRGRPESRRDYSQERSRICIKESRKDYFSAFGKRSRGRLESKHNQERRRDFNQKSGKDHNRREDGRDKGRRDYNPEESRRYPGLNR